MIISRKIPMYFCPDDNEKGAARKSGSPSSPGSLAIDPKKDAPQVEKTIYNDAFNFSQVDDDAFDASIPDNDDSRVSLDISTDNVHLEETGKDAEILVEKTRDNLRATIQIFPPVGNGREATEEMVRQALADKRIRYGIDDKSIAKAVSSKEFLKPFQVAIGTAPVDGVDAQLIYHYSKFTQTQDRSAENLDRIDFKELDLIANVDTGELLLEKIPATPGEAGQNVNGNIIRQVRGKDIKIRTTRGIQVNEDRTKFYAAYAGHMIFRNNELRVENIYMVQDVNAETGNIRFKGTVLVSGNVEDGYIVESQADIRVLGSVGSSNLIAKGNITINNGVHGAERAHIESTEGNIYCKFIQDAQVFAGGNIYVEEYIKNCVVRTNGKVMLTSDKLERAFIIGGKIFAGDQIIANNVGCDAEIFTELFTGTNWATIEEIIRIQSQFNKNSINLDSLQKAVALLQETKRTKGELAVGKNDMLKMTLQTLTQLSDQSKNDLTRYHALKMHQNRDGSGGIQIKQKCYGNVRVTLDNISMEIDLPIGAVRFDLKDGKIEKTFI